MRTIEDNLKELILLRYGTMINFSQAVNISNSTLSSIISRGVHNASVNNINKICKALDISADGLANNQIIPTTEKTSDEKHFKSLNEMIAYLEYLLHTNENMKHEGETLTDNDKQFIIDMMECSCHILEKNKKREK